MAGTASLWQANLGIGQISTANSKLDGTGTLVSCFTAAKAAGAASGGSLVTSIIIKATQSTTTQGMVRLFLFDGTNYFVFKEIVVPPTEQSSIYPTFFKVIRVNLKLSGGQQIFATTQNANTFNVFVSGYNFGSAICSTVVNSPSIKQTYNLGPVTISTANSNINGTGTLGTLFTAVAKAAGTNIGSKINRIKIKAQATSTQGMIRFFVVNDLGTKFLLCEIPVSARTQSNTVKSLGIAFNPRIVLNPAYGLMVSTQNAETFNVLAMGIDFICCVPT